MINVVYVCERVREWQSANRNSNRWAKQWLLLIMMMIMAYVVVGTRDCRQYVLQRHSTFTHCQYNVENMTYMSSALQKK